MEPSDDPEAEAERVSKKTDLPFTRRWLLGTGLPEDTPCPFIALDVGFGPGDVSACMKGILGPHGFVTGVDMSEGRVAYARRKHPGISFVQGSATQLPFPDKHFDYTWARFLFEYLQDYETALDEMVRVTRPSGIVVVGDLDLNCVKHGGMSPTLAVKVDAIASFAKARNLFHPSVGAELFSLFRRHSRLCNVQHRMEPYHYFAGSIPEGLHEENWRAKLEGLREIGALALGSHEAYAEFEAEMWAFLQDPDTLTYTMFHIAWAEVAS